MVVWLILAALIILGLAASLTVAAARRSEPRGGHRARPWPRRPALPGAPSPPPPAPMTEREFPMTAAPAPRLDPYAGLPDNHVLVAAPKVTLPNGDTVTVTEWLRRHHPAGEKMLMDVVMEMYRRAAGVPEVADYLRDADMSTLPRHFHAVLTVMTSQGLTAGLARRMGSAHADVRNSAGQPITSGIFDAVFATLAGILTENGIPGKTLGQIAETAGPLRAEIARDPAPVI